MRVIAALGVLWLGALVACGAEPTADPAAQGALPGASASSSDDTAASSDDTAAASTPAASEDNALASAGADDGGPKRARSAGERPLPAFGGPTVSGTTLSISSLIGRRMLLFFFNPEHESAATVAGAVKDVAAQQTRHNFRVVGIGIGSQPEAVRAFATAQDLDFPVIDDSSGRITSLLGLPNPVLVLGADAEGYVTFVLPGFDTRPADARRTIAGQLREALRIPTPPHAGQLIVRRSAPTFQTVDIDGKPFDFASLDGRPKIVMFFLHTCPHCHKAMAFFEKELATIPEASRPAMVAISIQNRPSAVRISLGEEGLDDFVPLVDPGEEIAASWGVAGGVPDISLVDANGEIVYRMQGWREDRDPALVRMYTHRIAGTKVPMLLSKQGYSGNDVCAVCHEQAAATWSLTRHARAFDTLVTHGREREGDCVSCHVVGWKQPGGYSFDHPAAHLEDVGCETCHGRGGPHLSPDFLAQGGYAAVCASCHDKVHSLGFDFATFLPGVSHAAIAALDDDERSRRFAEGLSHRELLPTTADYVGSAACQSCHPAEYDTWAKSPHASAIERLRDGGQLANQDCLRCHTTGFGRPGGFPAGGAVAHHDDLARVGCESCHGPGSVHAADNARRLGTITSLGDKCDSCVILQVCGSCHDAANDSDFEFSVQQHIDRQRHGTIEAGTGKPLRGAAARLGEPSDAARLATAFRKLDAPSGASGG